jgi:hypothetical protein
LPADPKAYELAYQEAQRALEDQDRTVVELRSRGGTLIAAAAITTSFFGGQALAHHTLNAAAWVAIGCFIGLGIAVLAILWPPRRDWEFAIEPSRLIATYLEPEEGDPLDVPAIQRDLALHMGASARLNRAQLRRLTTAFRIAAILLLAEVVAWVVVLVERS